MAKPTTLGQLSQSAWADPKIQTRTVKDELRANVVKRLSSGSELFPGVLGYDDTVIPQIVSAILAKHDFILLGLRGQAKSRILRGLAHLLDDQIPIIAGSETNDNPFHPISKFGADLVKEKGDKTPIDWIGQDQRYVEKLATPDVTVADILGDVDPIKAARGGHILADELTMHYGLLPRSNRGIFALNELPDLSGKIQVGLFNILQEGDIQIKGYPVRMALDLLLVFSANPEDYTARGKIITPLKDRIGSEVVTHYPTDLKHGMEITKQEAWVEREALDLVVPEFVAELVERIGFLARKDKRVDHRSGVSQRLPISLLELVVSSAEQRSIINGEKATVPRVSDLFASLPAITGKIELEYEGEIQGADAVAKDLVRSAAGQTLGERLGTHSCDEIVEWFDEGGALKIAPNERSDACLKGFGLVPGLTDLTHKLGLAPKKDPATLVAACELILEGLVAQKRISRNEEFSYMRGKL